MKQFQVGEGMSAKCSRCPAEGCTHVCQAGKVDTLESVEKFRGCTHINGSLEIHIRGGGQYPSEIIVYCQKILSEYSARQISKGRTPIQIVLYRDTFRYYSFISQ